MTKLEFITAYATKTGETKKNSEAIVNNFLDVLQESIVEDDKIQFIGFGTFEVRERKEKEYVNPKTKEKFISPAKKTVSFKASKCLKDSVNSL